MNAIRLERNAMIVSHETGQVTWVYGYRYDNRRWLVDVCDAPVGYRSRANFWEIEGDYLSNAIREDRVTLLPPETTTERVEPAPMPTRYKPKGRKTYGR